ncbi:MAG: type II toxin-antitoxin system mRNA interferase toxin, RelE/StbE family [Candidatus Berkelbacteria bacterium]|nr:type II toxin-antitoxin system mRNA interferase toxin, RelE/StbE family [Candidatus Berkelbacteria bacterium]
MRLIKTADFKKDLKSLPKDILVIITKQEKIFLKNWIDSRLHTKRIKELKGVFSFRITRQYRVLFRFEEETAVFFKIGHRKDVYDF